MGMATTIFRISHSLSARDAQTSNLKRVQDHVEFLLRILPEGAVFVKCIGLNIVDLSLPFQLTFMHPLFDDGTTFEDDWIRAVYKTDLPENGQYVHQVSVFRRIRYKFPEGSVNVCLNE